MHLWVDAWLGMYLQLRSAAPLTGSLCRAAQHAVMRQLVFAEVRVELIALSHFAFPADYQYESAAVCFAAAL